MFEAQDLHRRAVEALRSREFAAAAAFLAEARGLTDVPDLRARIDTTEAFLSYEQGDTTNAFRILEEVLASPALSGEVRGVVSCQHALLLLRSGRPREALTAFSAGIPHVTDPVELTKAHINRGGVFLQTGSPAAAAADFEQAVKYAEILGDETERALALHNLGYASMLSGDLVAALENMDAARSVLLGKGPLMGATADQDRAEVLLSAGLVSEGRSTLAAAAATFGRGRLHQRQGEAELTLARTLLHSDPAAALENAREARRRFVRSGADAWRVRADGVALAAEVDLGRTGPALLTRGEQLVEELTSQGLDWGAASVRLHTARVMIRRGDFDGARYRLRQVRVTDAAPLSLRLLARDVRSDLAMTQGRPTSALRQIRQGLEDLHAWQSSFGSLDLQTMVVGHGVRLAARGLQLAVSSGQPHVVHEWSERARMLASRVQPVRAPMDDEMAADLAELRGLQTPEDGPRLPQQRAQRDLELRTRVRERAWQLRGSGEVTEPATLAEVQAVLGDDTALVAWVVTADRVTALVVTGDGAGVHDLGGRERLDPLLDGLLPDLDVAAADMPGTLAKAIRMQLVSRLDDLGALLVAPLLASIGERRVVLTPSGVLAGTPWTLLPGLQGRPVTVANSATSWLAGRGGLEASTAGFAAGPRVARAVEEITAASKSWPGAETLLEDEATAEGVADLAGRVDVLHVAAHGRHSADNPLFSGLELAGGPWFGYDIDLLTHVPPVVILSACEVGRSSVRFGEELIGMTAAWLHAGARCVVASPSAVADDAAHDVLTAMHEHLARGLDPAAALAAAVPAVGPDAPPAPFVCFGTGW